MVSNTFEFIKFIFFLDKGRYQIALQIYKWGRAIKKDLDWLWPGYNHSQVLPEYIGTNISESTHRVSTDHTFPQITRRSIPDLDKWTPLKVQSQALTCLA